MATEQLSVADVIASAGGFTPDVNLYSQAGGKLRWHADSAMFVPVGALPGILDAARDSA